MVTIPPPRLWPKSVMFDVFTYLKGESIFEKPMYDLKTVSVCSEDGFISINKCNSVKVEIPKKSYFTQISPYMKLIHLDKKTKVDLQ